MAVAIIQSRHAIWRDYLELTKPKVVALMILTSVVGMLLAADGWLSLHVLIIGNAGIALVAAGGAAINHLVDSRIDQIMARTRKRPVAEGRISVMQAALFATVLTISGMLLLILFINPLTAWLTFASLIGYAFIYTGFLKRATPQNIVIGGLAGAAPPLLGWTAVTDSVDAFPLVLVLIIFAWTPPHFWALAVHREKEYAKAEIPMLPVTHGGAYTRLHILLYTLILTGVTLLPFATRLTGLVYLAGVVLLNVRFLQWSWWLFRQSRDHAAFKTFKYSITYLMLLFLVLLMDHYLPVML
ncbi:heme o synthase [Gynuella sunshinyii]|nr:heme o synthase [Gynuella sunshinyii]